MKKLLPILVIAITFCSTNRALSQTLISGLISTNTTWTTAGSPYIINGNTLVVSGATLTIQPGCQVLFNQGMGLQVSGILIAAGNSANRITFSANTPTPSPGFWDGVYTSGSSESPYAASTSYFSYCDFSYGGSSGKGLVYVTNTTDQFLNSTFTNSSAYGLYFDRNSHSSVQTSTISNNALGGIYYYDPDNTVSFTNNDFEYNKGYAIQLDYTSSVVISNNKIANNTGGINIDQDGGAGTATIQNNVIDSNSGYDIAAIYINQGLEYIITGNTITNNKSLDTNVIFLGLNNFQNSTNLIQGNLISGNQSTTDLINLFLPLTTTLPFKIYNNKILNNNAASGATLKINGDQYFSFDFQYNVITGNRAYSTLDLITFQGKLNNNTFNNKGVTYELKNENAASFATIDARYNFWNRSRAGVDSVVYDFFDNSSLSYVMLDPIANGLPIITSISPNVGGAGTTVGIKGTNFYATTDVLFGNSPVTSFSVDSATHITAVLGSGSIGDVAVVANNDTAHYSGFTYYLPPSIISFTPVTAKRGDTVTINGTNLKGATSLSFDGINNPAYLVISSTVIKTIVGSVGSGNVAVTTPGGTASLSGFVYIPGAPVVVSFSPVSAPIGTTVTIQGNYFNTQPSKNIVFFDAVQATVVSATLTQLTVKVPPGAANAPISVLNTDTHLTGYSNLSFIPTFTPNGNISSNAFSSTIKLTSSIFQISGIGDLDGDGKPDIVVFTPGKISIYRNTSTGNSTSFASSIDIVSDFYGPTVNMVIKDIDGDGKPDLIIGNSDYGEIEVFRNITTQGIINSVFFAAPVSFGGLTTPNIIRIADLDGDGKPDMIISCRNPGGVRIFHNTSTVGTINFDTRIALNATGGPTDANVADIDGDGKPDIIVGNTGNSTASIFRNISTPGGNLTASSFVQDAATLPAGGVIAVGDVDGDGKPDIAFNNGYQVYVLKNTSTSGNISTTLFPLPPFGGVALGGQAINFADINGDGKPDIYVPGILNDSTIIIFQNISTTGNSTPIAFQQININTGENMTKFNAADLDGDGKPDFVGLGSDIYILHNNIGLSPPVVNAFSPLNGSTGSTVIITGTGFNATPGNNVVYFGATRATVTAASATQLSVTVPVGATYKPISVLNVANNLTGYSASPFVTTFVESAPGIDPRTDFSTAANPSNVAIEDIDGDGKPDMIVANAGSGTVSVYHNTSLSGSIAASSFASKVDFAAGNIPVTVSVGDVDGDGKPDIVVSNYNSSTVSVLLNTSIQGTITATSFAAKIDFIVGPNPAAVAIGDIDGDGRPDLLVANTGSNTVSLLLNITATPGLPAFAPKLDINTGLNKPISVNLTDIDGDGKRDILIAYNGSNQVLTLHNTSTPGAIHAAFGAILSTGINPQSLVTGDIDGDGKPDIAVVNKGSNTISIFRNLSVSGTYSFAPRVDIATGASPQSLTIGDIDGDGKPELLVANSESNSITVYRNTSFIGNITAASFAQKASLPVGISPYGVSIADIDGDGKPDMLATNFGSNSVSLYHQSSAKTLALASFLQVSYDKTTNIPANNDMVIYPNPTSVSASVKYNLPVQSEVTISIYNKNGKLLNSFKTNQEAAGLNQNDLQTSNLGTGVYIITVNASNYNKTGRLIIQ